ncbi:uncharacterized mitochondrial protein-like protein [Tanacetum coccineum]
MQKEIQALEDNNTWKLCSLPTNKSAIGCKCAFKIKCLADGSIKRIKDLGSLHSYLGIEFLRNSSGIVMSQRKYALELIQHAGVLNDKPAITPLDPSVSLNNKDGVPLQNTS